MRGGLTFGKAAASRLCELVSRETFAFRMHLFHVKRPGTRHGPWQLDEPFCDVCLQISYSIIDYQIRSRWFVPHKESFSKSGKLCTSQAFAFLAPSSRQRPQLLHSQEVGKCCALQISTTKSAPASDFNGAAVNRDYVFHVKHIRWMVERSPEAHRVGPSTAFPHAPLSDARTCSHADEPQEQRSQQSDDVTCR